jgi:hypothetical protein
MAKDDSKKVKLFQAWEGSIWKGAFSEDEPCLRDANRGLAKPQNLQAGSKSN